MHCINIDTHQTETIKNQTTEQKNTTVEKKSCSCNKLVNN